MNQSPTTTMRHWQVAPLACALTLLAAAPTAAQLVGATTGNATSSPPVSVLTHDADGRVVVHATRVAQPIRIDGRLDEPAYREVAALTEFIQQEPNEGAPVSEKTEAWVMFDDTNIYITCRCWDDHPERIIANDMRRDSQSLNAQDHLAVLLDTFHDRRNGFLFYVTVGGGMRDGATTDERPNINWNGIWDGKASRFEGGWVSEMSIPFKTLRYTPGREQTWGIQLRRLIASKNERAHITPISPAAGTTAINFASQAATLVGIEAPPVALNLDIKPYGVSRLTTDRVSRPAVRNDVNSDVGIDVKFGVTKSLTADVTYNTDFAQVEADEAQINLTRFSLSLPEKREFFLEGAGIFAFGGGARGGEGGGNGDAPTIFYSRRIGLSGSRVVPVIAGGRFTGRAGPWTVGAFNMATAEDAAANASRTDFTVLRLRRDMLRRSTVGGIFTRRSVSTVAPGANNVWGVDGTFAFFQNVFLDAHLVQSRTEGRRGDDMSYRTQLNYTADRYGLALDRIVVEKDFNPEVGFLRRLDFRRSFAQARFSPRTTQNSLVRRWVYQGGLEYITNNENRLESREANGRFETEFQNGDSLVFQYGRLFESLAAPFEISEGVLLPVGGYSFDNLLVSYTAGQRHRMTGTGSLEVGSFYDGEKQTATLRSRLEVTPQLSLEPIISLNWIDLPEGQFTTTVVGGRTTFTMTPRMFVAALVQYSSSSSSLATNLRFRWEYQPGSEFFVVYTEGRSTFPPRGTDLESRGFVVKMNRLFRF